MTEIHTVEENRAVKTWIAHCWNELIRCKSPVTECCCNVWNHRMSHTSEISFWNQFIIHKFE